MFILELVTEGIIDIFSGISRSRIPEKMRYVHAMRSCPR